MFERPITDMTSGSRHCVAVAPHTAVEVLRRIFGSTKTFLPCFAYRFVHLKASERFEEVILDEI